MNHQNLSIITLKQNKKILLIEFSSKKSAQNYFGRLVHFNMLKKYFKNINNINPEDLHKWENVFGVDPLSNMFFGIYIDKKIVNKFYKEVDLLCKDEKLIHEYLLDNNLIDNKNLYGIIIINHNKLYTEYIDNDALLNKETRCTFIHELSHALFANDKEYKSKCYKVYYELVKNNKLIFNAFDLLATYIKCDIFDSQFIDELIAYLIEKKNNIIINNRYLTDNQIKLINELKLYCIQSVI